MSLPHPHRGLSLPGVHGYTSSKRVRAGGSIELHLSTDVPLRIALCRLGSDPNSTEPDTVLQWLPAQPAAVHPIHPGAYVHLPRGLPARLERTELGIEFWIHPWHGTTRQCVIGQMALPEACGWGVFLEPDGSLACYLGDGSACNPAGWHAGPRLQRQRWQHVVIRYAQGQVQFFLDGQPGTPQPAIAALRPGPAPLRLAACGAQGVVDHCLDADLAMPVLYERAPTPAAIAQRHAQRGRLPASGPEVLACWPLGEGRGEHIADSSGWQRDGHIVNQATWGVAGPATPATGAGPASAALRFCSDALYDCRWPVAHTVALPADLRPGLYVFRAFYETPAPGHYDITFFVTPAADTPPARLLVLGATCSWLAYAATPFPETRPGPAVWPRRSAGLPSCHPEAPAYCSYTQHRAGQPCFQVGLRMPWPNASPDALYDPADSGFAQWVRLERHLHTWLDRQGYDYDLLPDLDLHEAPARFADYDAVVINGHSEYWSYPMVRGLDDYLRRGGKAIVLSGNTMYLRVSFDAAMTVMEQRKVDAPTATPFAPEERPAELPPAGHPAEGQHSQDGYPGGHLHALGLPAAEIIGLETAGWAFASGDDFGVYHAVAVDHPLFQTPEALGLRAGDTFGHGPDGQLPRAIGHEWDLSTATRNRMTQQVPDGLQLPQPQAGITVLAEGRRAQPGPLDTYLDSFGQPTDALDGLSAEMILWQRPQGGTVFHAGAVGASWVLGHDPVFEALLRNVLAHFGIARDAN